MSNTIYMIKNNINSKVYIGQTTQFNIRKYDHIRKYKNIDYHIYRAMRKYGVENFSVIPIFNVLNVNDLDDLEIQFIKEYDSFHNGYNMNTGGQGVMRGRKHTTSTRRKISEANKKRFSIKSNHPWYNKTRSKEDRDKMSKSHRTGYYHTPWGTFTSKRETQIDILPYNTINRWCKNPDKQINKCGVAKSKYLTEEMLGKTFKEIGFWFEPV